MNSGLFKSLYRKMAWLLPEKGRIALLHLKATGHWPRLNPPHTFNEKMCWRKIHLRKYPSARQLLVRTCDKVRIRGFVRERIGAGFLTEHFHSATSSRYLPWELAPSSFVVKANHGSTWNHFVRDKAKEDFESLHRLCDHWLGSTWGGFAGEWWYSYVKPQILIEELLEDGTDQRPNDFKFFVMRGEVNLIQVDFDRFISHKRNLYTPEWKRIAAGLKFPTGKEQSKPKHLKKMLKIAGILGREFDFVRVDLYAVGDRIIVGELTHCPGSGWEQFTNGELDRWLGARIAFPG